MLDMHDIDSMSPILSMCDDVNPHCSHCFVGIQHIFKCTQLFKMTFGDLSNNQSLMKLNTLKVKTEGGQRMSGSPVYVL